MRSQLGLALLALPALFLASLAPESAVAQGAWTTGASYPGAGIVRGAGVWFAPQGRFLVMGGRTTDTAGSDLLTPSEYNPATNAWAPKVGAFPTNEVNNMVAAVLNEGGTDYVFCVGGSAAGATTATPNVRRYDPVADVIITVATDPWPAVANTLPGGGAVFNNRLYVFGGFTINIGMINQIWEYDPNGAAGSRWTLKASTLATPVGYVPVSTIGSLIYVAGGAAWTGTTLADSAGSYVYDPVLDTINPIAAIPRATGETQAVDHGGALWVLGGGRVAPNPSNQVDAYSVGSNTWSLGPSFVTARRNSAIATDPVTGRIFMVGGYAPTAPINGMEIFETCLGVTYCTAKTNSCGGTPAISSTGIRSVSSSTGFVISGSGAIQGKFGLMIYGPNGRGSAPFQGGILCVDPMGLRRSVTTSATGGTGAPVCDATLSMDFNSFAAGTIGGNPAAFLQTVGQQVNAQWWARDTVANGSYLSNGIEFVNCP